ncbi:MAG: hypothetical protein ACI4JW_08165, partial [Oscillospiraceae bacterium]
MVILKTRACPFCGKEISDEAIICKFCHKLLIDENGNDIELSSQEEEVEETAAAESAEEDNGYVVDEKTIVYSKDELYSKLGAEVSADDGDYPEEEYNGEAEYAEEEYADEEYSEE